MKKTLTSLSLFAMCGVMANAQEILEDSFTRAPAGAAYLTGRSPYISLAEATWMQPTSQLPGSTSDSPMHGNPAPAAIGGAQHASAISISSTDFYSKPKKFTVSADLMPGDTVGEASQGRGIALGFFNSSVDGKAHFSSNQFIGLVLDAAGNLALVDDPSPTGYFERSSTIEGPVAFVGTFDPNLFYTLRYTVDTVTGEISNISLSGSTADYSSLASTTQFTDLTTAYAGFYTSSEVAGTISALDNLIITAEPESSTKSEKAPGKR